MQFCVSVTTLPFACLFEAACVDIFSRKAVIRSYDVCAFQKFMLLKIQGIWIVWHMSRQTFAMKEAVNAIGNW